MRKTGHISHPENDWHIAERQGEDRARAETNVTNRQRRGWAEQGRDHCGNYPGPAIIINKTRKMDRKSAQRRRQNERTRRTRKTPPRRTGRSRARKIEGRQRHEARQDRSRQRRGGRLRGRTESAPNEDEGKRPKISTGNISTRPPPLEKQCLS